MCSMDGHWFLASHFQGIYRNMHEYYSNQKYDNNNYSQTELGNNSVHLGQIEGPVWYTIYHSLAVIDQPTNGKRTSANILHHRQRVNSQIRLICRSLPSSPHLTDGDSVDSTQPYGGSFWMGDTPKSSKITQFE